ncbi:MAG: ester cyclase [Pyramidobacter sp.]|nr:ester cyclase [Pyramidobacter sp.]
MNNKDLIKYFYEVIVSEHRLDELPKYISEHCAAKNGEKSVFLGLEGMKQHISALKKTYPDLTLKVIRQFAEDDYVISELIMKGTHQGQFLGITPTGHVLTIAGINIDKVSEGKIVEHAGVANTFETFYEHHLIKPV